MMPAVTSIAIRAHSAALTAKKPIQSANAADLTSKLTINNRPPRDERELAGLFDDGELAAR